MYNYKVVKRFVNLFFNTTHGIFLFAYIRVFNFELPSNMLIRRYKKSS